MSDFLAKNKRTRISKIGSFLLMVSLLSSNFFYLNLPTVSAEEASPEVVPQEDPSGRDTLPPAGTEAPQEEPATLDTSELDGALGAQPGGGEVNEIPSTTPEINLEDTQPAEDASTTIQIPTTTPEENTIPGGGGGGASTPVDTSTSTESFLTPGEISATSTQDTEEEIPSPAASSTNPFEELTSSSTLEFPDSLDLNPLESLLSPASTTNISTDMAELVIPQNLSGAMIVRYKNKLSGSSLEVSVEGAATSSELTLGELKYSYPDAFPGTDLLYEITKGGIKESIILKEGGHPTQFKYRINLDQFDFVQNSSSTIILYKKWEKDNPLSKLYTLSAPKMIDGTGNESADISFEVEGNILVLTPQAEWLFKATYPIVIDPTIEISVLNIHSHPVAGDLWNVDFMTEGAGDLSIAPADEATVEEDEFVSLFCGEEDRTASAEIREGDVIFYPNWSCDGVATVSHKTLVTGNHHLIFTFQGVTEEAEEVQTAEAFNAALIWTGLAGDGKYSTAGNWSTAKVPSSADSVSFDNTCTNCNVTIDVSTTTVSFTMAAAYPGTITQSNDTALTVSGAFSQSAGSFVGGSGTTTIGGNFTLNGGSFNAPTTTVFYGAASNISVFATTTFYNIEFNSNNSAAKTITSANGLEITATTTLTNGLINTGNISALGAVIQSSGFDGGSANLYLNATTPDQYWYLNGGTGPDYFLSGLAQNYSYYITANSTLTSLTLGNNGLFTMTGYNSGTYYLTINTLNQSGGTANMDYAQVTNAFNLTGGTFNSSCTATTTFTSNFTLSGGVFNGCSGTVRFRSSFAITGGTFNAPSTTSFYCPGCGGGRNIDVLGTQAFDNLEFDNAVSTHVIASGDTLVVNGTLTLTGGAINGPGLIKAKGDIVQNSFGGGNVIIDLDNDSLSQTYSFNGGTAPHLRLDSAADASDSLVFNASSGITQFTITSDFAGTIPIVNPGNHMITIGGFMKSYSQAAGVFPGGAYTVRFVSDFLLSGTAVFNAPSTTSFYCPGCGGGRNIDVIGTQVFDNVIFDNEISTYNIPAADTLIVNGTLSLTSGDVNGGAIKIRGDVIQGPNFDGGTVLADLDNDSLSQTWTINGGIGLVLRLDSPADANDSIIFNAAGGFRGVTTTSEFSGIIPFSNPSNHSITIGASGWQQAAGTFNLNSANFIDGGTFNISNSSFIGGTGTTSFASHLIVSGASTFVAASTTEFYNNPTADITLPDFFEFHNFYYNRSGWNTNITNNSNLIVNGLFTFAGGGGKLNGGTIQAKGNIVQAANSGYSYIGGTTIVDFANDSLSQTWTVNGGFSPTLRLDSAADANDRIVFNAPGGFGGATITPAFSGDIPVSNPSNYEIIIGGNDWQQAAGTLNLNSANFTTIYNSTFTLSGGSFIGGNATTTFGNSLIVSGSGNFIAASTTQFNSGDTSTLDVPDLQEFENFYFNKNGGYFSIASNKSVVVNNRLTLSGGGGVVNGGTIQARGNVNVYSNFTGGGTAFLAFIGSADQTFNLTGATGMFNSDITVNKSGGEVTLLSALVMDAANQDLTIQSGTFDLNGNNLQVNGSASKLIVNNSGNLQLAGNETITTLTNYPQLDSGSSVIYDGSGSYTLKDYAYKNLSLLGSGTFTSLSGTLNIAGNLSKESDSVFAHNSGTVNLNGTNQTIAGSFTFNNLTKSVTSPATLTFASSSTQTILGALTLSGASGNLLSLRSNDIGEQWLLDPQGARTLQYLDVKDSNNINATRINAINTYSLNSGNNLGWDFNPTFSQSGYRWYSNSDTLTPSSALALQNAVAIIPSVSSPVRLRMNVSVSSLLPLSSQAFKLQVSTATSTGWVVVNSSLGSGSTEEWWNSSFSNRRKITFNNASSTETLLSFPVLVSLTSSNIDYSKTENTGADIRFVDADGTTELNYEIEKWDEAATSTVWVKVPQIDAASTTDFIWMYYNNGAAVSTATTTGVWDDSYVLVQHLGETTGTATYDSTQYVNNGTKLSAGEPIATSTGYIDGAQYFDGSNDWINAGNKTSLSISSKITLEAWINPNNLSSVGNVIRKGGSLYYLIKYGNAVRMVINDNGWGGGGYALPSVNQWYHVVGTFDGLNRRLYVDGVLKDTQAQVSAIGTNTANVAIGNNSGGGEYFGGKIDEVRISNMDRSSSWIYAEYLTESDQYQTYSAEETVGDTAWRFYDNPSVSSGSNLSSLLLSSSTVQGSYQEENPTILNPFTALAGDFIEFDFSLDPAGILPDTNYYFRLAKADGSELEAYDYYPTIRYEEYVAPTYRTVTWDRGAGTNNWADALNWSTDEVPTETDDVVIGNYNVSLAATTTVHSINYGGNPGGTIFTINSVSSLIVTATTTLTNGYINGGIISAQGNVIVQPAFDGGTATLDFGNDSESQTMDLNGGAAPKIRLDTAADANDSIIINATTTLYGLSITASFSGTVPISNVGNYQITIYDSYYSQAAGSFIGGPWTLVLDDADIIMTGGSFIAPSTTRFTGAWAWNTIDAQNTITFENFELVNTNNYYLTITSGDAVIVTGTTTLTNGRIEGGILDARGNVVVGSGFDGGDTVIDFGNDSLAQTLTVAAGGIVPGIRFDDAADANDNITINSATTFYGLNITAGFGNNIIPIYNPANGQITLLDGGYYQAAGTFAGGPWTLVLDSGDFTVTGGTFNAPTTTKFIRMWETINVVDAVTFENFELANNNAYSLTIASGDTVIVTGTTTLTNGGLYAGTLNARGNVIVKPGFDGGSAPLIFSGPNNQTFDLTGATSLFNSDITINKSGGAVELLSALVMDAANQDLTIQQGTLDLNGQNLTVNGAASKLVVNNPGNLQLMGSEAITALANYPQLDSGSTVTYDGSASYIIKDYTYQNLTLAGPGTYTATSATLYIAGNFTHTAGTFAPNNGTVVLNGTNQTITGSSTFFNLTKTVSSADTLTFTSSSTQTILGALSLSGVSGGKLSLRSSEEGEQWNIDPQGTRTISHLDVKDSDNINTLFINASDGTSINSGNNRGWIFESNAPTAGSASISSVSQTEMAIKISGASDDSSLAALPYVFHNITTGFYFSATSSVFATSTLLSPNTSYSFEVGVYDQYGNSATTTPVSAVTLAAVPSTLSASQGSANTELNVVWNANNNPAGTEYMVRNETSSTDSGWITGASHVFNGLACNTSYAFSVKARNADNIETASSASVSGTTSACATNPPVTPPGGGSGGGGGGSPKLADLSIVKTSDRASVKAGQTVIYVLTAHNAGPEAANNVKVTDFLDANLVFVSDLATQGKYNNHSGLWNIGTLNPGGSAALTLTVVVKPGTQSGTISNLATIYSSVNDLALLNNSSNASLNVIGKSSCISLLPPPARFERTLGLNSKGEDVRSLQKFLNDNDFEVAASGPGSKGKETLSFGSMTESALTLFQLEFTPYFTIHGKTGRLDSATRAFINDLLIDPVVWCPNSPETPPLPPLPPEPPLPPVAPEEPPVAEVVPPVIPPNEPETPIIIIPPLPPVSEVIEDLVDQGGKAADVAEDIIKSTVSDAFKAGEKAGGLSLELVIASYTLFKVGEEKLVSLNIDPEASAWVGTITIAPSVMFLQYSLGTQAIIINSVGSLADVWFMMLGFFHGLLTTLGLRSRRRYWGTVYDSKTKQPIDPAIVELIDAESGKVIETSVTDLAGRFGFLDKRGKYFIKARKTHYAFPSQIVTGNTDSIFQNVYHGELIEITEGDDLLAPNIPMDALAFDWNQMEKQKIIKFHPTLEMAIQWALHFLFWSGFAFVMFNFASHYNLVNGFFVLLYIALIILRRVIPNQKLWGRIISKKADVSGLLLEISPTQIPQVVVARSITNKAGKFFLKTSPGDYIFRIKKINGAALDTLLESDISVGREGVVNKLFSL